jgi:SAM-dependent methyltransferase
VFENMSDRMAVDRWLLRLPNRVFDRPDPTYQKFLAKEIDYWTNPPVGGKDSVYLDMEHPLCHPKLLARQRAIRSGSPDKTQTQYLLEKGPFHHALTLSDSPALKKMMGAGVAERWTCNSISGRLTDLPIPSDRVSMTSQDLNFATLEPDTYDLIVAEEVLHHIINIDALVTQIRRALRPGGYFFVYDYIGEERFRWTPAKRRYLNGLLANIPLKYQHFPFVSVDALRVGPASPFEAVSSMQNPSRIARQLELVEERRGDRVFWPLMIFLKEQYLMKDNPILDRLLAAEDEGERLGLAPVGYVGLYRKRG